MKLSVSNIAWSAEEDAAAFHLLRGSGIPGLEIAPTRCWPGWSGITQEAVRDLRASAAQHDLRISSLQAILFAKPGLQLFGPPDTRDALADHLESCGELCNALGGGPMVFGAPKNRNPPPELPAEEAFGRAVDFFQSVGSRLDRTQSILAIEANPREYGALFLTTATDAARLVRAVGQKSVGLHLDTACMHLAGDDWRELILQNADILVHLHVSEPFLGDFDIPACPHAAIYRLLREVGYQGWVTLEMRRPAAGLETVRRAIEVLMSIYGDRVYATV